MKLSSAAEPYRLSHQPVIRKKKEEKKQLVKSYDVFIVIIHHETLQTRSFIICVIQVIQSNENKNKSS